MNRQEHVVDLVKAAFIVLIVKVMASSSAIMPWNSIVDNICIAFAICIMLAKFYRLTIRLSRLLALGAVFLLVLYTCVSMKQYDLMVTLVAVCLLIDEDLEEYIPLMLKVQAAILIGHIAVSGFLSLTGSASRFWFVSDGRLRFNGGFAHSNVLSCYILSCMMMFAWKHFRRISANQFAGMVCITALTYLMSRSRTGLLLNLLLLALVFLTQNTNKLMEKLITPAVVLLFPGLTALLHWAQTHYMSGSRPVLILDDLLTGRIKYAAYGYLRSGLTWLPRYLDYADSGIVSWSAEWNLNTFTFDCLYSFLLIQMGMIWLVIFTLLIAVVCRKFDFRNRLFLLFWILFSIVEVHGLNCFRFFPLLLLSTLLSNERG